MSENPETEGPSHELVPVHGPNESGADDSPGATGTDGHGPSDTHDTVGDEEDLSSHARERRRTEYRQRSAGFDANTFIGAVYVNDGQHVNFGGTGSAPGWTPTVGYVSPQRLRVIERSYVTAPNDPYLADTLHSERLVFLNGHEHSGRSTSATMALASWARGRGASRARVGVLAPDGDFTTLTSRIGEQGGYLVDATDREWANQLTQASLDEVRSLLDRRRSTLVVLVDTATVGAAVSPHLVQHLPPDTAQVYRSALGLHLSEADREAAFTALSPHRAVREWIEEMVAPAEAVALAELVADRWQRGRTDDLPIPEQRHRLLCEWSRRLLDTGPTADAPTHQAYVLATAILDGHAVSTVVRAAARLDEGFHRVQRTQGERTREVFDTLLQHRIRHVRVEIEEPVSGRTAPRQVVRLRHPRLSDALLDVLWSEFDTARTPFIAWLRELCEDQDARVRISAAQALGRLAGLDFPEVKRRVLIPMSASKRRVDHQAVSWLLEKAHMDGVRSRETRDLLRSWSRSGDPAKVKIALRSYTTAIAREHPDEALRGVREAVLGARSCGNSHASLAATALAELYAVGDDEGRSRVLDELLGWIRLEGRTPEEVPQTFVRIVMVNRRVPSHSGAQDGDTEDRSPSEDPDITVRRYDLLERLASGRIGTLTVAAVAALWATALLEPALSGAAWEHLTRWDESAPDAGPLRETTEELLSHLGKIAPLTSRINLYLAFREHRDGPGRTRTKEGV